MLENPPKSIHRFTETKQMLNKGKKQLENVMKGLKSFYLTPTSTPIHPQPGNLKALEFEWQKLLSR